MQRSVSFPWPPLWVWGHRIFYPYRNGKVIAQLMGRWKNHSLLVNMCITITWISANSLENVLIGKLERVLSPLSQWLAVLCPACRPKLKAHPLRSGSRTQQSTNSEETLSWWVSTSKIVNTKEYTTEFSEMSVQKQLERSGEISMVRRESCDNAHEH